VRHASTGLADGPWHLDEKPDVQRADPLLHDEEEDERKRHQGEQDRRGAESDEQRRRTLPHQVRHAATSAGSETTLVWRAPRAIPQISRRDSEFTTRVMMKSTSPISMSACRYNSSAASVNSLASTAAMVYCGAKSDADTRGLFPITIV